MYIVVAADLIYPHVDRAADEEAARIHTVSRLLFYRLTLARKHTLVRLTDSRDNYTVR